MYLHAALVLNGGFDLPDVGNAGAMIQTDTYGQ